MKFNIITIFPNLISQYCAESILGRAQKQDLIEVNPVDLRGFATDKHKSVDDTPYGGGAGMVLRPEPIYNALKQINAFKQAENGKRKTKKKTFLLSPRGRQFDQRLAEELVKLKEITFVCGRYEGVDQRVSDYMVDEEVSIGPYVLAGGELGALTIIEAVARLVPGVLGNPQSLSEETFNKDILKIKNLKLEINKEYAQYTKPEDFMGWKVPEVLLSGHHKKIEEWRKKT